MLSVRIINVDHYMSAPIPGLDVTYSEFRGSDIKNVPVIRIFGTTPSGIKTCVHVHRVFPYIYIPYDGSQCHLKLSYQIAASLDKAINITQGNSSGQTQHVYKVVLVSGVPFYGYHRKEHQFLKIYFYKPSVVKQATNLLQNGAILNTVFQPHEAHIPFILQFFIDFNLYGMSFIKFNHARFRRNGNKDLLSNISEELWLPHTILATSVSQMEADVIAADILNRSTVPGGTEMVNPGLASIWEDERKRRAGKKGTPLQTPQLHSQRPANPPTSSDLFYRQRLEEKLALASQTEDSSLSGETVLISYPVETPPGSTALEASFISLHGVQSSPRKNDKPEVKAFDPNETVVNEEMVLSLSLSQHKLSQTLDKTITLDQDDLDLLGVLENLEDTEIRAIDNNSLLGSQVHQKSNNNSVRCTPAGDLLNEDENEDSEEEESKWLDVTVIPQEEQQLACDVQGLKDSENPLDDSPPTMITTTPPVFVEEKSPQPGPSGLNKKKCDRSCDEDSNDENMWNDSFWDSASISQLDGTCDESGLQKHTQSSIVPSFRIPQVDGADDIPNEPAKKRLGIRGRRMIQGHKEHNTREGQEQRNPCNQSTNTIYSTADMSWQLPLGQTQVKHSLRSLSKSHPLTEPEVVEDKCEFSSVESSPKMNDGQTISVLQHPASSHENAVSCEEQVWQTTVNEQSQSSQVNDVRPLTEENSSSSPPVEFHRTAENKLIIHAGCEGSCCSVSINKSLKGKDTIDCGVEREQNINLFECAVSNNNNSVSDVTESVVGVISSECTSVWPADELSNLLQTTQDTSDMCKEIKFGNPEMLQGIQESPDTLSVADAQALCTLTSTQNMQILSLIDSQILDLQPTLQNTLELNDLILVDTQSTVVNTPELNSFTDLGSQSEEIRGIQPPVACCTSTSGCAKETCEELNIDRVNCDEFIDDVVNTEENSVLRGDPTLYIEPSSDKDVLGEWVPADKAQDFSYTLHDLLNRCSGIPPNSQNQSNSSCILKTSRRSPRLAERCGASRGELFEKGASDILIPDADSYNPTANLSPCSCDDITDGGLLSASCYNQIRTSLGSVCAGSANLSIDGEVPHRAQDLDSGKIDEIFHQHGVESPTEDDVQNEEQVLTLEAQRLRTTSKDCRGTCSRARKLKAYQVQDPISDELLHRGSKPTPGPPPKVDIVHVVSRGKDMELAAKYTSQFFSFNKQKSGKHSKRGRKSKRSLKGSSETSQDTEVDKLLSEPVTSNRMSKRKKYNVDSVPQEQGKEDLPASIWNECNIFDNTVSGERSEECSKPSLMQNEPGVSFSEELRDEERMEVCSQIDPDNARRRKLWKKEQRERRRIKLSLSLRNQKGTSTPASERSLKCTESSVLGTMRSCRVTLEKLTKYNVNQICLKAGIKLNDKQALAFRKIATPKKSEGKGSISQLTGKEALCLRKKTAPNMSVNTLQLSVCDDDTQGRGFRKRKSPNKLKGNVNTSLLSTCDSDKEAVGVRKKTSRNKLNCSQSSACDSDKEAVGVRKKTSRNKLNCSQSSACDSDKEAVGVRKKTTQDKLNCSQSGACDSDKHERTRKETTPVKLEGKVNTSQVSVCDADLCELKKRRVSDRKPSLHSTDKAQRKSVRLKQKWENSVSDSNLSNSDLQCEDVPTKCEKSETCSLASCQCVADVKKSTVKPLTETHKSDDSGVGESSSSTHSTNYEVYPLTVKISKETSVLSGKSIENGRANVDRKGSSLQNGNEDSLLKEKTNREGKNYPEDSFCISLECSDIVLSTSGEDTLQQDIKSKTQVERVNQPLDISNSKRCSLNIPSSTSSISVNSVQSNLMTRTKLKKHLPSRKSMRIQSRKKSDGSSTPVKPTAKGTEDEKEDLISDVQSNSKTDKLIMTAQHQTLKELDSKTDKLIMTAQHQTLKELEVNVSKRQCFTGRKLESRRETETVSCLDSTRQSSSSDSCSSDTKRGQSSSPKQQKERENPEELVESTTKNSCESHISEDSQGVRATEDQKEHLMSDGPSFSETSKIMMTSPQQTFEVLEGNISRLHCFTKEKLEPSKETESIPCLDGTTQSSSSDSCSSETNRDELRNPSKQKECEGPGESVDSTNKNPSEDSQESKTLSWVDLSGGESLQFLCWSPLSPNAPRLFTPPRPVSPGMESSGDGYGTPEQSCMDQAGSSQALLTCKDNVSLDDSLRETTLSSWRSPSVVEREAFTKTSVVSKTQFFRGVSVGEEKKLNDNISQGDELSSAEETNDCIDRVSSCVMSSSEIDDLEASRHSSLDMFNDESSSSTCAVNLEISVEEGGGHSYSGASIKSPVSFSGSNKLFSLEDLNSEQYSEVTHTDKKSYVDEEENTIVVERTVSESTGTAPSVLCDEEFCGENETKEVKHSQVSEKSSSSGGLPCGQVLQKEENSVGSKKPESTGIFAPLRKPPSRDEVEQSLQVYGIPEVINRDPFYGNRFDVKGKKEIGGQVLNLASYSVVHLEEFSCSIDVCSLKEQQRRLFVHNWGLSQTVDSLPQLISSHASSRETVIVPVKQPPTVSEVRLWQQAYKALREQQHRTVISAPDIRKKLPLPHSPGQLSDSDSDGSCDVSQSSCRLVSDPGNLSVLDQNEAMKTQSTPQHTTPPPLPSPTFTPIFSPTEQIIKKRKKIKPLKSRKCLIRTSSSPTICEDKEANDIALSPVDAVKSPPVQPLSPEASAAQDDNTLRRLLLNSQFCKQISSPRARHASDVSACQIGSINNSHGFRMVLENLQDVKVASEYQFTTVMTIELHIQTLGELKPDPERDPIRAVFYSVVNDVPETSSVPKQLSGILVVDEKCGTALLEHTGVEGVITYSPNEKMLLQEFVSVVRLWDPDILAGFEVEMLSWGYLVQRSYSLGINILEQLSRVPEQKHSNPNDVDDNNGLGGLKLAGRIVLDVWRLLRSEVALQSYTFENVVYHILHQRVPLHSFQKLSQWWETSHNLRRITARHYQMRVMGVTQLLEQLDLIGRTSELARLFGIQFFEVLSRGSQFRVESMMLRLAKLQNYVPVSPSIQQRARMRAPEVVPLIMEPESRFYSDPVIVLDFQSLYPSIIIAYNYCFSTCLGRVEHLGKSTHYEFGCTQLRVSPERLRRMQNDISVAPCGVAFVSPVIRRGVLPRMLEEILEARLAVKQSMKSYKDNHTLQRVLHARQLGLKLIANVTYGYTSANFSGRMPCIEVGDSVVSKARETLERAIAMVHRNEDWRARVVYGDTDSMFVLLPGRSRQEAFRVGAEIAEAVTQANPSPVKLKLEKVYQPSILQTKKRYVGFMYESPDQKEPVYDAKGIETVRRDGCPAVSKVLEKSLRLLFETRDVSLVKRYVCRQFSKLLEGRVSVQDLIYAREYRGMANYRPGACVPALELTRRWLVIDRRAEPRIGERVPYVIVNGPPGLALIRLVRHPSELIADPSLRLNAVYYITRAIIPPLERCFSLIGADVPSWYAELPRKQQYMLPVAVPQGLKKSTISQYFSTLGCACCGNQTHDGVCTSCRGKPQALCVALSNKIHRWESSFIAITKVCESCTGRSEPLDCVSLDCPILYRRLQASREKEQENYVRQLLNDFLAV